MAYSTHLLMNKFMQYVLHENFSVVLFLQVKAVMLSYIEIEGAFLLRSSFTRVGMFTFSVVYV